MRESGNQGVRVGTAPFTITPNDPLGAPVITEPETPGSVASEFQLSMG